MRTLLVTLREASRPLGTVELTETVMKARGLPVSDIHFHRTDLHEFGELARPRPAMRH
jgi:hypothetical protein